MLKLFTACCRAAIVKELLVQGTPVSRGAVKEWRE
jgi:hypothetical protein